MTLTQEVAVQFPAENLDYVKLVFIIQVNLMYFFLFMNANFKRQGCVDLSAFFWFVYRKDILNLYQC